MWTDPEEARSDFILAAAAALFAPLVIRLLASVAGFLFVGNLGQLLQLALIFAAYGLVPILLANYRGQGIEAFGLSGPRDGLLPGLLLAAPIVVIGAVIQLRNPDVGIVGLLLGNLNLLRPVSLGSLIGLISLLTAIVWNVLLFGFLTVKARHGFARNEIRLLEGLRTFGMGAAGLALAIGLLTTISPTQSLLRAILEAVALALLALVADRFVDPATTTTRATLLAPAIVALLIGVELFSGQFLATLRQGILGAGAVIVVAVMIETRRYAWAVVPLFAALVLYASALRPA